MHKNLTCTVKPKYLFQKDARSVYKDIYILTGIVGMRSVLATCC